MFSEMATRKYTQRKRARQQEETRERILEATIALHERLGAARTTISAVAREAGVQRLTVYRHFPDDASLLRACTSSWLDDHPLPDRGAWAAADDPVRKAFSVFFHYYRSTERMWASSYRDVDAVEALQGPMEQVEAYLDTVATDLANTIDHGKRSDVLTVIRHGLRFTTWQSLTSSGASDAGAAGLLARWVECVSRA